jgi:hypothetical protein
MIAWSRWLLVRLGAPDAAIIRAPEVLFIRRRGAGLGTLPLGDTRAASRLASAVVGARSCTVPSLQRRLDDEVTRLSG